MINLRRPLTYRVVVTRRGVLVALLVGALALTALGVAHSLRRSPDACQASRDDETVRVIKVGKDTHYRVLGDSISTGTGLAEPDEVWLQGLAVHAQAEITVDAQAGMAFVHGGPCGDRAFTDRVDRLAEPGGRGGWYTVVVQGGSVRTSARTQPRLKRLPPRSCPGFEPAMPTGSSSSARLTRRDGKGNAPSAVPSGEPPGHPGSASYL